MLPQARTAQRLVSVTNVGANESGMPVRSSRWVARKAGPMASCSSFSVSCRGGPDSELGKKMDDQDPPAQFA